MQWNNALRAEAEHATLIRASGTPHGDLTERSTAAIQFVRALWTIERSVNEVKRTRDRIFTKSSLPGLRHAPRVGHDMVEALGCIFRSEQKKRAWVFSPFVDHALDAAESLGIDTELRDNPGQWRAGSVDQLNRWIAAIRAVEASDLRKQQVREGWRARWEALEKLRGFIAASMRQSEGSRPVYIELSTPSATFMPEVFMKSVGAFLFQLRSRLNAAGCNLAWKWDGQGDGNLTAHLLMVVPRASPSVHHDSSAIALEAWKATLGVASGLNPPRLSADASLSRLSLQRDGNVSPSELGLRKALVFLAYADAMNGVTPYAAGPQLGFGSLNEMAAQTGYAPAYEVRVTRRSVRPSGGPPTASKGEGASPQPRQHDDSRDGVSAASPVPSTLLRDAPPGLRATPKPAFETSSEQKPSDLLLIAGRSLAP